METLLELSEIVNPHYAFPVVGVLLCALLVFAFGFKSTSPPPSFGFVEERNKTSGGSKRRKAPSVAKKSTHNGQVAATTESSTRRNAEKVNKPLTEKLSSSPKSKPQNSARPATEATVNKQIIKNKKSEKNEKNTLRKREDYILEKHVSNTKPKLEDGEWVQLLSRKEKKNRRREEFQGGGEEDETKDNSEEATPDKKPAIGSKTELILDLAVNAKVASPAKKKKKANRADDDKEHPRVSADVVVISDVAQEVPIDVLGNDDTSTSMDVKELAREMEDTHSITKPAPKETNVSDNEVQSENKVCDGMSRKKKDKNRSEPEMEVANIPLHTIPTPPAFEDAPEESGKRISDEAADKPSEHSHKKNAMAGGVAFDELGDIWREPKTQKKKKKARRDQ